MNTEFRMIMIPGKPVFKDTSWSLIIPEMHARLIYIGLERFLKKEFVQSDVVHSLFFASSIN
ncbi:MAG: hypothetical protein K8R21_11590 [Leptospira sp.]|nr:hypothetical protein [Leptospira sp.]